MVSCEECEFYEQKELDEFDCVKLRNEEVHFTGDMVHTAECCEMLGIYKPKKKELSQSQDKKHEVKKSE